ncbi:MAG: ATP-dependent RecD-like DNA helicase [Oscillospiraceae bacterium]|nr:ATP-dependent RecD-like DNA helicase [Oscillospiraceae bacterium]
MNTSTEKTELHGIVEDIVYQNSDTGYGVIEIDADGMAVTLVGDLAFVKVGEEIAAYGNYVTHPNYGVQFRCDAIERTLPTSATAIMKYLSNGAVTGIGPSTAKKLVKAFGTQTLEVMAREPEKLVEIKGISMEKAKAISSELAQMFGLKETIAEMTALGLSTDDALQLYKVYGLDTSDLVKDNPYLLCGFPVYKDFVFVDGIAEQNGIGDNDPRRIRAGLVNTLRHNAEKGHTCVPTEKLIDNTKEFLLCDRDAVEIELFAGVEEGFFGHDAQGEYETTFLLDNYQAEKYIAERIRFLAQNEFISKVDADREIDQFEEKNGIIYEELQREAIAASLTSGVVVLTGGPGTGKTTTVNTILALCEKQGNKVALCAPTGRAAKRMSELTGKDAKTIHRLLEVDYGGKGQVKFVHNENNTLKYDLVIVDEMSMVDCQLFADLLKGLKPWCRLVLVGDSDQLPSVGAGNVLRDIISSGVCKTVALEKIFRQAAQSLIVVNAHTILEGRMPDLTKKDNDFFYLPCEKEDVPKLITDLVSRRLPKSYRFDPIEDIQVITPSKLGLSGTAVLNEHLREKLNPPAPDRAEIRMGPFSFREQDKVMVTRNAYEVPWTRDNGEVGAGMFNGDIGTILKVDKNRDTVYVKVDDRTAEFTFDQLGLLDHAYAITVHKSQGSEFPAVILAVGDTPRRLRYRNLLYTAITRAKRLLIIVGSDQVVQGMVENDGKLLRYTGLERFLLENDS